MSQTDRAPVADLTEVPREAWRGLMIGAAGFVLVGFNSTATNIAFGDIADTFSTVPETTVAFVSSGYLIGTAAFLPIAGRVADRRGRTRMFQLGLAIFWVSSFLSAIAPSIWVLIGARVLQSIGGALVIPASLSMVLPLFPASRRSSAVATWAAAGPLSAAVAPSVSAGILEISDWRWLYFVSTPVAAIVLAIALHRLREVTPPDSEGSLDLLGAALGTVGIALIVFGVGKGQDWGWTTVRILGCFVAGGVAIAAFLVRSARHKYPVIDLTLFRDRQVWMTNLANTLVSVTSLSIWLVWPLYLSRVWDYSSLQVGAGLTPGPVMAAGMTLVGGRVADRFGHRAPIQIGSVVMVAAVAWCWLVLAEDGTYLTSFMPGLMLFGTGWGLSSPAMNSFALAALPESTWGAMNAAFNMLRNVAGAIGVAAAVAILGSSTRPDLIPAFDRAFSFFFAFTLVAALTVIVFYPRSTSSQANTIER